jgi:hypothetical protein
LVTDKVVELENHDDVSVIEWEDDNEYLMIGHKNGKVAHYKVDL